MNGPDMPISPAVRGNRKISTLILTTEQKRSWAPRAGSWSTKLAALGSDVDPRELNVQKTKQNPAPCQTIHVVAFLPPAPLLFHGVPAVPSPGVQRAPALWCPRASLPRLQHRQSDAWGQCSVH